MFSDMRLLNLRHSGLMSALTCAARSHIDYFDLMELSHIAMSISEMNVQDPALLEMVADAATDRLQVNERARPAVMLRLLRAYAKVRVRLALGMRSALGLVYDNLLCVGRMTTFMLLKPSSPALPGCVLRCGPCPCPSAGAHLPGPLASAHWQPHHPPGLDQGWRQPRRRAENSARARSTGGDRMVRLRADDALPGLHGRPGREPLLALCDASA